MSSRRSLSLSQVLRPGTVVFIHPGDYFTLVLPDGRQLRVEQTQDDFSITKDDDIVAYTTATSPAAKADDVIRGWDETVTGRN